MPLDNRNRRLFNHPMRLEKCVHAGLLGLYFLGFALMGVRADDILFVGNSFTYGGAEPGVADFGGVPKLVEAIAASKGKAAATRMVTTGGKDWGFHLKNPVTDEALRSKAWNWVVLQDYSSKPTHAGNVDEFMKNGQLFYDRIVQESPQAQIVLYATWALGPKNAIFSATPSSKQFADPAEMTEEIAKNYDILADHLRAEDSHREVRVAPVGLAFAQCLKKNPEISLYGGDSKHANRNGSYLAALVIYATIFHDSPQGATGKLPGFTLPPEEAAKLQAVAGEVCEPAAVKP